MKITGFRLALAAGVLMAGAVGAHANTVDVEIEAVLSQYPSPFLCSETPRGPQCARAVVGTIEGEATFQNQCVPPMDCAVANPRVMGHERLYYSQTFQNVGYYFMDYKTKVDAGRINTVKLDYTVAFTAFPGWVCQKHVSDRVAFTGGKSEIKYRRAITLDMSDCSEGSGQSPVGGGSEPINFPPGGPFGGVFPGSSGGAPAGGLTSGLTGPTPSSSRGPGHP